MEFNIGMICIYFIHKLDIDRNWRWSRKFKWFYSLLNYIFINSCHPHSWLVSFSINNSYSSSATTWHWCEFNGLMICQLFWIFLQLCTISFLLQFNQSDVPLAFLYFWSFECWSIFNTIALDSACRLLFLNAYY